MDIFADRQTPLEAVPIHFLVNFSLGKVIFVHG